MLGGGPLPFCMGGGGGGGTGLGGEGTLEPPVKNLLSPFALAFIRYTRITCFPQKLFGFHARFQ